MPLMRADEDLSRIFTWQEEHTLTGNLVVHFKRVSYLVRPNAETRAVGGSRREIRRSGVGTDHCQELCQELDRGSAQTGSVERE